MKNTINEACITFPAKSENEALARSAVSAFCIPLDPTLEELSDVRTAVSEAVTNAIVHGYKDDGKSTVFLKMQLYNDKILKITVRDKGCGIENIPLAMTPLYSSDPSGERGGMGFSIMESFMDDLKVISTLGKGTSITMVKRFSIHMDTAMESGN